MRRIPLIGGRNVVGYWVVRYYVVECECGQVLVCAVLRCRARVNFAHEHMNTLTHEHINT